MPSTREVALRRAVSEFVNEQVEFTLKEIRQSVERSVRETLAKQFGNSFTPEHIVPAVKAKTAAPAVKRGPGRPPKTTEFKRARCNVAGCKREYRSKGYCGAHYQKALTLRSSANPWPIPCPRNFKPDPTLAAVRKPGRPAKAKVEAVPDSRPTRQFEVTA